MKITKIDKKDVPIGRGEYRQEYDDIIQQAFKLPLGKALSIELSSHEEREAAYSGLKRRDNTKLFSIKRLGNFIYIAKTN